MDLELAGKNIGDLEILQLNQLESASLGAHHMGHDWQCIAKA